MSEGRLPAGAAPLRYEGSQSESVLSNAMRQASLGPSAATPSAKGLMPTGMTGQLLMDEGALLGYGSNGTMVFKGTWNGEQVAVKRMHIAFVEMVDAEMKVLLELGAMEVHRGQISSLHPIIIIRHPSIHPFIAPPRNHRSRAPLWRARMHGSRGSHRLASWWYLDLALRVLAMVALSPAAAAAAAAVAVVRLFVGRGCGRGRRGRRSRCTRTSCATTGARPTPTSSTSHRTSARRRSTPWSRTKLLIRSCRITR